MGGLYTRYLWSDIIREKEKNIESPEDHAAFRERSEVWANGISGSSGPSAGRSMPK